MSDPEALESTSQRDKPRSRIWVLLTGLFAIGAYAAMVIPALTGQHVQPQSAMSSILWSSIFFTVLWRYRSKNGWVGFAIGIVLAIVFFMASAFIGGYVRSSSGI